MTAGYLVLASHFGVNLNELFAGRESATGEPALYICQNFACQEPAVGLGAIEAQLEKLDERVNP